MAKKAKQVQEVTQLPDIGTLINESIKIFKTCFSKLVLINLIGIAAIMGMVFAFILLTFLLGLTGIFTLGLSASNLSPFLAVSGIVLFIIFFIGIIVAASILQAANLLIIDKPKQTLHIKELYLKSLRYVLPMFVTSLLLLALLIGHFFLFLIPAFIFGVLFGMAPYEVVLNNQKAIRSIKRSFKMVSHHFFAVYGRQILLFITIMAIGYTFTLLAKSLPNLSGLINLIQFFVNMVLGWFGMVYTVTLYKQIRESIPEEDKGSSLILPIILAIIGWIIAVLIIFAATSFINMVSTSINDVQNLRQTDNNNQDYFQMEKEATPPSDYSI